MNGNTKFDWKYKWNGGKKLWDDTDDEEMKMKEDHVSRNKDRDLSGVINEKEADEADETDEADKANKAPVYEIYF